MNDYKRYTKQSNTSIFDRIPNGRIWAFLISAAVLIFVAFYFFFNIIFYLLTAFIISMIGKPVVNFLETRFKIPKSWGSAITLAAFLAVFAFFVWQVVPLIIAQADALSQIDYREITGGITSVAGNLQEELWRYGILDANTTLESAFWEGARKLIAGIEFNAVFSDIFTLAGNFFVAVFSIVFVAFFFLKDEKLFYQIILLPVPTAYEQRAENIVTNSRKMLTRYFVGLAAEVISMMTLISIGLSIFGVKNALLLGFMGGMFNIIPYLGPVIGATLASLFSYIGVLSGGYSPDSIWVIVKVVSVFSAANLIDNMVLQPLIYSNSVRAHPLEIFIVIMMSGTIGGVLGMVLAIPAYTLLRIIAKEFFRDSKFVKTLTAKM